VYDAGITDKILESGTYVSFTLQAGGIPTLLELRNREAQGEVLTPADRQRKDALEAFLDMKLEILRCLLRDGMAPRLMISTDAGPFDVAFGALQIGMELAVEAGMSPREAIDAATRIPGEACKVANVAGSIKPTLSADLLIVDGDPLQDIADLWRVRQVYARGAPQLGQVN
jgi:imidazolonepropionase-like amidohydrolase